MRDPETGILDFGANVNGTYLGSGADVACPFDLSHPYATQQTPCNTESTFAATLRHREGAVRQRRATR